MKTLEQLLAMIDAGQTVILNGEHHSTKAQVEEAYPAAALAHDAAKSLIGGGSLAASDVAELREFRPPVSREEFDALAAKVNGSPSQDDVAALTTRNGQQADLIDALTKNSESLALLDDAGIAAVALFEGVKVGKTKDETVKAVLAKRGG